MDQSKKKKRKEKSLMKWLILVLLGIGLLLGGIYIYFLQPEIIPGLARRFDKPVTGILIAVDEDYFGDNGHEKVRADLILFGRISPDEQEMILIFIPRHTLVEIPELGEDKIRFSYMAGERPLTQEIVESLLDEKIDYYGVMDFDSFQEIIAVLEGVEILLEDKIFCQELELDLQLGLQMLTPKEALNYARYLGEDETELDRIRRQQKLAIAIYHRALETMTLARLPQLVMTIIETVKNLDTNVDRDAVIKAVNFLREMGEPYPNPLILPGYQEDDYWIRDEEGIHRIIKGVD